MAMFENETADPGRNLRDRDPARHYFFHCQLPVVLLIVPVAVLFLGIVADPEETHAVWYGMLNTIGIFDLSDLYGAGEGELRGEETLLLVR